MHWICHQNPVVQLAIHDYSPNFLRDPSASVHDHVKAVDAIVGDLFSFEESRHRSLDILDG